MSWKGQDITQHNQFDGDPLKHSPTTSPAKTKTGRLACVVWHVALRFTSPIPTNNTNPISVVNPQRQIMKQRMCRLVTESDFLDVYQRIGDLRRRSREEEAGFALPKERAIVYCLVRRMRSYIVEAENKKRTIMEGGISIFSPISSSKTEVVI